MKFIFLDSNIFLSFYDQKQKNKDEDPQVLKKLLELLNTDSELSLLLPNQIEEEFINNKIIKLEFLKALEYSSLPLPLIMNAEIQVEINKKVKELNLICKRAKEEYTTYITNPESPINKDIEGLFNNSSTIRIEETDEIFKKIEHRKLKGHPPKNYDAISWECILDYMSKYSKYNEKNGIKEIIIVTNDNSSDIKSLSDPKNLNEYLSYELKKHTHAKIFIFDNLSECINHLTKENTFIKKEIQEEQKINTVNLKVTTISDLLKGQNNWVSDAYNFNKPNNSMPIQLGISDTIGFTNKFTLASEVLSSIGIATQTQHNKLSEIISLPIKDSEI